MNLPSQPRRHPARHRFYWVLYVVTFLLSIAVFYGLVRRHIEWKKLDEAILVLAPCIVFSVTTLVYYEFITEYTGEVAGLSVAGLFVALWSCMGLANVGPEDWETHLKLMYGLFFSYVVWDWLMMTWLLPGRPEPAAKAHMKEIAVLSTHINQPTLITIFGMWVVARNLGEGAAKYVTGVVGFHLIFAALACVRTIIYWKQEAHE